MLDAVCSRRNALAGLFTTSSALATNPLSSFSNPTSAPPDFLYCLNVSTLRGQELGIVRELEVTSEAGYDAVEVWMNGLQKYVEQGGSLSDLRKRIDDLGLSVANAIGFVQWIVDDNSVRQQAVEQLKREMDTLAQLGCSRIAAPPMGATKEPGLDLMKAAERYRAILELGESQGVIPQLEVWGFSANLHRLGQSMFVAVESQHPKARILPDIYHLYKGGSEFNGLKLLSGSAIEIFHINDYPAQPSREQLNDSHRVYPGDGVAPVTEVLQDLHKTGSGKILSLELFNEDYWQQDALTVAKTGLSKMKNAVARAIPS
ncbi:sugar phosphate isomerase/epimerase family protein [Tunicatimonas pelagia]|uniref:sugar phosphate isomerase/epimerase family protein n=1 Tax=Tunicatimonas pelagia TaxID=931531 RepID=UPI0026653A8C|nr:sugar phosphate isomerase/epimerase family protein [Tunicatimonas pelagia]WKN42411.1 sugar phosphate isomerase/epimerase [Tunicatimonas pelagia]